MLTGNYRVSPGSGYVEGSKTDELKTTWAQVTGCITDYSWKAIYASTDEEYDAIVAEMIQKANEYGYQDCWDWSNEQAAIRKAAEDAVAN
jgi:multiple sugar transport system substrate-binding protein/putative aldouronate transport system substrate-binding protein